MGGADSTLRDAVRAGARDFAVGWWRGALVFLALSLLAAVVVLSAIGMLPGFAAAQRDLVLVAGEANPLGLAVLVLELGAPVAALVLLGFAVAVTVVLRWIGRRGPREKGRGSVLLTGLVRAPSVAVVVALGGALVVVLAALAPLLMLVGVVLLLVSLVLRHRAPVLRRWALLGVVPFGLAVWAASRWLLAPAVIAFEGGGPIAAARRSHELVSRAPWSALGVLAIGFGGYALVEVAAAQLAALGAPAAVESVAVIAVQVLGFAFPLALVGALYRGQREPGDPPVLPLVRATRPVPVTATVAIAAVALVAGMAVVGPVAPAAASPLLAMEEGAPPAEGPAPAEPPPAEQPSIEQSPVDQPPVEQPPAEQPPAEEPPANEPPADPAPARILDLSLAVQPGATVSTGTMLRLIATVAEGGGAPDGGQRVVFGLADASGREIDLGPTPWQFAYSPRGGPPATADLVLLDTDGRPSPVLAPGVYTVTASIEEGGIYAAASTSTTVEVIAAPPASTSISFAADGADPIAGESVRLRAVVTTAAGDPATGTVLVYATRYGGSSWPRLVPLDASGTGVLELSTTVFSGPGTEPLRAIYLGDVAHASSVVSYDLRVLPIPVAVSLATASPTSAFGDEVTLTATLTPALGGTSGMYGTVRLRLDDPDTGVELASAPAAAVVELITSAIPPGAHTLYAVYDADPWGRHASGSSAGLAHVVGDAAVRVALTPVGGSWTVPVGADLEIEVSPELFGTATPPTDGQLRWRIGDQEFEEAITEATSWPILLTVHGVTGEVEVVAELVGSATHPSLGPTTATVSPRTTDTVTAISVAGGGLPGGAHRVDFAVTGEVTGAAPADGHVEYRVGDGPWLTAEVSGGGTAVAQIVFPLGVSTIQARYLGSGDGRFGASPVASLDHAVDRAPTAVTASVPPGPVLPRAGEGFALEVSVAGVWPLPGPAAATVVVMAADDGSGPVELGRAEVVGGVLTSVAVPGGLPAGTHRLTVIALESGTHASASVAVDVVVRPWESAVSLSVPQAVGELAPTVAVGQRIQLVATVSSGAGVVDGGTVEFRRAGLAIGSAPVVAGIARLDTWFPTIAPTGTVIVAEFVGADAGIAGSVSDGIMLWVAKAWTQTSVAQTPASAPAGAPVQLVATVAVAGDNVMTAGGAVEFEAAGGWFPVQSAPIGPDGTAVIVVTAPADGVFSHAVTVRYGGTTLLMDSWGSTAVITHEAELAVSAETDAGPVVPGREVEVRAAVAPAALGGGLPSNGTAVLLDADDRVVATRSFTGAGPIVFRVVTPSGLGIGVHELRVRVTASGFLATESAPLRVEVAPVAATVVARPVGAAEVRLGEPVSLAVEVAAASDVGLIPDGAVRIRVDGQTREALLVLADGRATATLPLPDLPVGEHEVLVEYRPGTAQFAAAQADPVLITVLPRSVAVSVALVDAGGRVDVTAGAEAALDILVREVDTPADSLLTPSGSVRVRLDGEIVATLALVPLTSLAGWAKATVRLPAPLLTRGDHELSVEYLSVHPHPGTTAAYSLAAAGQSPVLSASAPFDTEIAWGEDRAATVLAGVAAPSGSGLAASPALLEVSVPGGADCAATVLAFLCSWPDPGPGVVRLSYPGDAYLAPATLDIPLLAVVRRAPVVSATIAAGDLSRSLPAQLTWRVVGPAAVSEAQIAVEADAAVTCLAADAGGQGRCLLDYGPDAEGIASAVTVAFAGDGRWLSATWTGSHRPEGCYHLDVVLSPEAQAAGATVRSEAAAAVRCGDGGYLRGAVVNVIAVPPAGDGGGRYDWRTDSIAGRIGGELVELPRFERRDGDRVLIGGTLVVGTGAGQTTSVRVEVAQVFRCATVQLVTVRTDGQTSGTLRDSASPPTCPGSGGWVSTTQTSTTAATGAQSVTTLTGRFILGDTVATRFAAPAAGAYEYYGYRASGAAGPLARTWTAAIPDPLVVTGDVAITAMTGPVCYPVTVALDPAQGTVRRLTGGYCSDPLRVGQTIDGSTVRFEVRAVSDTAAGIVRYPVEWGSSGPLDAFSSTTTRPETANVSPDAHWATVTATVRGAPLELEARFGECYALTLAGGPNPTGGSLQVRPVSTCPIIPASEAASYRLYAPGTTVTIQATPASGRVLGRWNVVGAEATVSPPGEGPSTAAIKPSTAEIRMDAPVSVAPTFITGAECTPVSVQTVGGLVVRTTALAGSNRLCEDAALTGAAVGGYTEAQLVRGPTRFTIEQSGDALLGWEIRSWSTARNTIVTAYVAGDTLSLDAAESKRLWITAIQCQRVHTFAEITGVDGVARLQIDAGELIGLTQPTCPFDRTAWRVDLGVRATALADERGYTLTGWSASAATSASGASAAVALDGTSPSVEIVAQFDVTCYTLTVTGRAHRVTLLPEPNCPGAPRSSLADGVLTARYVGGTPVALVGEVPGGNVWQGWAGDLVETGRVAVAVAIMDQDRAAEHRYRDKTTGEQVTEAFESIGNGIAIAMKKVVGGVMFAANEALFGAPPLGVISTVTAGISLVGMALEAAGVPSSVTKYFDYPAQTISMMSALMGCAASWGIAGNGGASAGGLGADRAAPVLDAYGVVSDTRDVATELADASSDAAAWLAVARANYGSVAKAMDAAGAAMDVAGTAIAAYQLFTSGPGAGWDASASAAWTDFSTYTSCFASNIPDYLRGAVGGSDEYWADIDREWG